MVLEEMTSLYHPWCCLQQPVHPAAGMNVSFRMLLAALDQGWKVVETVQSFSVGRDCVKMFHFTLVHGQSGHVHQLSVAATREVEQFLRCSEYEL